MARVSKNSSNFPKSGSLFVAFQNVSTIDKKVMQRNCFINNRAVSIITKIYFGMKTLQSISQLKNLAGGKITFGVACSSKLDIIPR